MRRFWVLLAIVLVTCGALVYGAKGYQPKQGEPPGLYQE